MDKNMKKAILKNRVKLLNLDYFDLSGPLLASEIFPSKKHKEIKTQANDSKARVDLLLEWLEDSAPKEAFPIFLNGIRNCKELILAKKIKREASGKEGGPSGSEGKPKASGSSIPLDQLLAEIIPTLPATLPVVAAAPPKAKKPRVPKPKTNAPPAPVPINGLPSTNLLPPPPPPVTKKRKAEGDAKQPKLKLPKPKPAAPSGSADAPGAPKTPKAKTPKAKGAAANKQNGTPKTDNLKIGTPKTTAAAIAAAAATAAAKAAAAMAAAATPRATRKSSSSDTVQGKADKGKGAKGAAAKKGKGDKKAEAATGAGGTSPKRNAAAKGSNPMTFKEVEEKQQDFKNKFKFTNSNAMAKVIHFKDKSDITYLGCPFMVNNKMCGKKVELKSKEFICEAKHKNPNCRQIPRLLVTFNDGTGDLVLTLMKQNVEVFSGKSEGDIESMTVDEIKTVLDKTVGKKINVEVTSEKAKKQGVKKGATVKWNNVAAIIEESDEPPNKKKRKN